MSAEYVTWYRLDMLGFPLRNVWFENRVKLLEMVSEYAKAQGVGDHVIKLRVRVLAKGDAQAILDKAAEDWGMKDE